MVAHDLSSRFKLADTTSTIGAAIIGLGLGVLLAPFVRSAAWIILIGGVVVHAWGMTDKHRFEQSAGADTPIWSNVLHWVCWLMLGALGVMIVKMVAWN